MKKHTLLLLFFLTVAHTWAQEGFNSIYLFPEYKALSFTNGLIWNDHIYLLGGVNYDSIPVFSGLVLAKADTNGQIKDKSTFFDFDPVPRNLSYGRNFPIMLTTDSLIALGGLYSNITSGFVATYDPVNNQKKSSIEIAHSGYHFQSHLLEMPPGWLTIGGSHAYSGNLRVYISRVDSDGNILWEKNYGEDAALNYIPGSVVRMLNGDIVIGAGITKIIQVPPFAEWMRNWVFAIDTSGNKKWEWASQEDNTSQVKAIQKVESSDWIYVTTECDFSKPHPLPCLSKIIRRDSLWNLVWEKIISPTNWSRNQAVDMKPSPDGTFIVATESAPGPAPDQPLYRAGCLHKITAEGDEVWRVCDTAYIAPKTDLQEPYVGGVVVLPSGSSVLIGDVTRWAPDPPQSYGWMFKVDANGCMYAPCSVPVEEPSAPDIALAVYPNPATEQFTVRLPELKGEAVLEAYDALGRLMAQAPIAPGQEQMGLAVLGWPAGVYVLRLVQAGRVLGVGRVVVR